MLKFMHDQFGLLLEANSFKANAPAIFQLYFVIEPLKDKECVLILKHKQE